MDKLRIVFFGTPGFATHILDGLVQSRHEVVGVVTVADKPSGRGQKVSMSDVKKYAVENGLNTLQPTNLKSPAFIDSLKALKADLFIVVAFRMLPRNVWNMPHLGTFNLHASLLPQYRGAAPINWAVIHGEQSSGVTTFFIDDKIDTGEIIAQSKCHITPRETAGSLYLKLMELGRKLTIETADAIADGRVTTVSQKEHQDLMEAPKLDAVNTVIDFNNTAANVDALVRGLNPFPIAKAILINSEKIQIKIFETEVVDKMHSMTPGDIVIENRQILVACSLGFVILKKLQLPGKKPMSGKDLLNGYKFENDARFDKA